MLPAKKRQKKCETLTRAMGFAVTKECYQMLPRFFKSPKLLLSQGLRRVTKMLPENVTSQKNVTETKKASLFRGAFSFFSCSCNTLPSRGESDLLLHSHQHKLGFLPFE